MCSHDSGIVQLSLRGSYQCAEFRIGDMNIAGRLYMGAGGGRGVIYWEDKSIPVTDEDSTIVTSVTFDNFSENSPFVNVWPNPAQGGFNVEINENKEEVSLTVFDVFGRVVEEIRAPAGVSASTVGERLTPGTYYLMISGNARHRTTIRLLRN